jgi:hypothetical protein
MITDEQKRDYRLMALELASGSGCCGDTSSLIENAKTIYKYITKGE